MLKQNSLWVVDLHEHQLWPTQVFATSQSILLIVKMNRFLNSIIYVQAFQNCIETCCYTTMNDVIVIVYIMLFVYMVCAGTTEEDWSCFVFSVQALIKIGDTFDKLRLYKHLHDTRVRWDDACEYEWFERWDGVFPADKLTESWNVKSFSVMLIHAVLCSVPIYPKQLVWISD